MKSCKFCNGKNIVKNGKVNGGNQRYKCRDCARNFTITKSKYSITKKVQIIKAYLNGVGFRQIERIFDTPNTLVLYWIKKLGTKLEKLKGQNPPDKTIIQILEADELFTYVGKKTKSGKSMDGSK